MDKKTLTNKIKTYAKELGFDLVGITSAEKVSDFSFYEEWVSNGFAGEMEYLKRNLDKREDPSLLFPETKAIICLGFNYFTDYKNDSFKVAKYALGDDYHDFLKVKINNLLEYIKTFESTALGKVCVDTAPVLERSLAVRAGLGWIGKNTLLINKEKGSYFLLGELFLNLELEYDPSYLKDYCGNCNKCMVACPTNALIKPKVLDSNLCISYLTIEAKTEIPESLTEKTSNYIFGCDICQDVCPWNKSFSIVNEVADIQAREWLKNKSIEELLTMDQETFSKTFKNSPIKRSKLKGFLRNVISMITGKNDKEKYLPILKELTKHSEEVVRNQAEQAINKIVKRQEDKKTRR